MKRPYKVVVIVGIESENINEARRKLTNAFTLMQDAVRKGKLNIEQDSVSFDSWEIFEYQGEKE